MKYFKRSLIALFIFSNLYAILCGGLYFFQDNLIFHPQPLPIDYAFDFDTDFEEVWIDAKDGAKLHGLNFTAPNAKGTILYFHGNAGSLARWGTIVGYFVDRQYNVMVMDYRQFGKSSGRLSEDNLYSDSIKWYSLAKTTYPDKPITVYGRSLGTTFATYVASKREVKQLILETPFYSIVDEAKSRFPFLPVQHLLKYEFPTYKFINDVKAPITILHGTDDRVVNHEHGKQLYQSIDAENKKFVTIPEGGHNNLSEFTEYQNTIKEIL